MFVNFLRRRNPLRQTQAIRSWTRSTRSSNPNFTPIKIRNGKRSPNSRRRKTKGWQSRMTTRPSNSWSSAISSRRSSYSRSTNNSNSRCNREYKLHPGRPDLRNRLAPGKLARHSSHESGVKSAGNPSLPSLPVRALQRPPTPADFTWTTSSCSLPEGLEWLPDCLCGRLVTYYLRATPPPCRAIPAASSLPYHLICQRFQAGGSTINRRVKQSQEFGTRGWERKLQILWNTEMLWHGRTLGDMSSSSQNRTRSGVRQRPLLRCLMAVQRYCSSSRR